MSRAVTNLSVLVTLGSLLIAPPSRGDTVILDPIPVGTITGTAGLTGETFANGQVSSSAASTGYSASFASDGNFSVTTGAEATFSLVVNLYQFQNTPGAQLRQQLTNQSALVEGEARSFDLRRIAGRVSGSVAVVGGTVESISLTATSNNAAVPESFRGNVSVNAPPFLPIMPMPVVPGLTTVTGSVTILSAAGCRTARSLPNRSVTVLAGAEVATQWTVDVSAETCSTGTLQGSFTTSGLTAANADALESSRSVSASGPEFRSANLPVNQTDYLFENLRTGSYRVTESLCFQSPYSCYSPTGRSGISVTAGQVTQYARNLPLATAHGALSLSGAWSLADLSSAYVQASSAGEPGGSPYDYLNLTSGQFDLVVPAGTTTLNYYYFQDSSYDPATGAQSYWRIYENRSAGPRVTMSLNAGDRAQLDAETIETSVAALVFQVAQQDGQPESKINRLNVNGNGYVRDAATNAITANRNINQDDYQSPASTFNVSLRGLPGTYQMQARGYGTDGRQYVGSFELTLGAPNDTPAGTDIETAFTDDSGQVIGSLTFQNVLQGGDTTVSQVSLGPNAPRNFKVFRTGGQPQYFDITTTAVFDGSVEVCIQYDDSNLSDPTKEANLELAHYDEATATWDPITNENSPDTVNNRICGTTNSFSIFAILEVDIIDADLDGLTDDVDNCPATTNPGQQDFDGDGIGDACDSDTDGDNLPDDTDRCPNFSHPDNGDLDSDGVGDPCDSDVDGDSAANGLDNCPVVANADQMDFDSDGSGDQCDVDDDGDTITDATDACPGTELGTVIDTTGCSSPQRFEAACPIDGVYRNHGQYVSCVAREANAQAGLGLISLDDKGVVVSTAAQTTVTTSK